MSSTYHANTPDVVFRNFQVDLPANRPIGGPHIIDTRQSRSYAATNQYTIADAIATLLCRYKAEALNSFLDDRKPYFVFQRRAADAPARSTDLEREGSRKLTTIDLLRDGRIIHVRYSLAQLKDAWLAFVIERNGQWTPLVRYTVVGGFDEQPAAVLTASSVLAQIILEERLWKCPGGMTMGWREENTNARLQTYMLWRRTFDPNNQHHQTAEWVARRGSYGN